MVLNPTWPTDGEQPWGDELRDGLDEIVDDVNSAAPDETGTLGERLDAFVAQQSKLTSFFDDFTVKANATIAVGGTYVSTSGHTVTVTGQLAAQVTSGRFTHTRTNTATVQSTYLSVDLGVEAGDKAGYLWVEYDVPAGADPQQSLELIFPMAVFGPPNFTDAAAHVSFGDAASRYDTLEALGGGAFTTTILGRAQYPTLVPGSYRAEVSIDGTQGYLTVPGGRRWRVEPSALVPGRTSSFTAIQLYNNVGTFKALQVSRWGAELQRRVSSGPYVSPAEVSRVAAARGQKSFFVSTGASVATALTTSLSAKLLGGFHPIPASRRLRVSGFLWFDEAVPTTRATSALLIGAYLGGGTSFGTLRTVFSGYTPANATVDDAAFANRQGTMTAYTVGRLWPWSVDIVVDPAFTVGDLIEVQIKAQANATSRFTFIDSGDASGGTSTLRQSSWTVEDIEAP
jgi:hypothetical protein